MVFYIKSHPTLFSHDKILEKISQKFLAPGSWRHAWSIFVPLSPIWIYCKWHNNFSSVIDSCGVAVSLIIDLCWWFPQVWVHILVQNSEVFSQFNTWCDKVLKYTMKKIEVLRSDNGREFKNMEFDFYFDEYGIQNQFNIRKTPQENCVSKHGFHYCRESTVFTV